VAFLYQSLISFDERSAETRKSWSFDWLTTAPYRATS
jgi:hypothetical protein